MIPLLGTAFRAGMLAAFLLLMTVAFTACGGDGVQSGTESNEGDPRITEVRTAVAGSGGVDGGGVPRGTVCDGSPSPTASANASGTAGTGGTAIATGTGAATREAAASATPSLTGTPCPSATGFSAGSVSPSATTAAR